MLCGWLRTYWVSHHCVAFTRPSLSISKHTGIVTIVSWSHYICPKAMENLQKASQQQQAISVFPLHVVTHIFFFNIAVWWHHAWVHCSVIICQDKVTDMIKEKLPFNKKNYSISHFLFFFHTEFLPNNFLWGKEIVILMNYRYTCILLVFPI